MLRSLALLVSGFVAAYLPLMMRWPDLPVWVPLALLVLGLAGAITCTFKKRGEPGRWRLPVTVILGLAVAFHVVWLVSLSSYGSPAFSAPAVGATAPDVVGVRVRDGAPFQLAAQREYETLLVFFRGPW